ncbi:MAG: hypothetical protein ABJA98_01720 [Acidobacteriota bacterium]
MSASVLWEGLEELKAQLRTLPADLTEEASHIVQGAANSAEATIKAGYSVVSGDLRDHLFQSQTLKGRYGVGIVMKNTAKHAWLYDNGSQARHYITASGKDHKTGASGHALVNPHPPTHLFVKTMAYERRRMYDQLKDLLMRHGLTVSGDA